MIGRLPVTLEVNSTEYDIRTDFRDVLCIFSMFGDSELYEQTKAFTCLRMLYKDFDSIPEDDYQEAYNQAVWFLDCGQEQKGSDHKLFDWENDANIIFPAINKTAGFPVRSCEYLHWWDFIGYFNEIEDGLFSYVLGIKQKILKNKKLDKAEQEFAREHPNLVKVNEGEEKNSDAAFFLELLGGNDV